MQKEKKLGGQFQNESDPNIPDAIKEINELIRKAQNRTGSIPKQIRDEALMELCRRFKNLIQRHAKRVYRSASGISKQEWYHDALTTFIELVVDDYRLKEEGGSAFFGHYINQKLYFRLLDKSQKSVNHYNRQGILNVLADDKLHNGRRDNEHEYTAKGQRNRSGIYTFNQETFDIGINDDGYTVRSAIRQIPTEVFGSVVANFCQAPADAPVVNDDRRKEIVAEAVNIMQIAKRVLKDRDYEIFEMHFASGLTASDIAERIKPQITAGQIRRITHSCRESILVELGRQRMKNALAS